MTSNQWTQSRPMNPDDLPGEADIHREQGVGRNTSPGLASLGLIPGQKKH